MCPLCSSTRATPLKIMTTARRSVHTFIGSKEVFRTKTLPFIPSLILRERRRECQNYVAFRLNSMRNPVQRVAGEPVSVDGARVSSSPNDLWGSGNRQDADHLGASFYQDG